MLPEIATATGREPARRIRVGLYLDPARLFQWHLWLAEALAAVPGHEVSAVFAAERRPLPRSCALLFELERLVYGLTGRGALKPAGALLRDTVKAADRAAEFDVVIDCAGVATSLPQPVRIVLPCFDGIPGEIGLIAALADRKSPLVEVHDSLHPGEPLTARPALADRHVLVGSADDALSCAVRLIVKAVQRCGAPDPDAQFLVCPPGSPPLLAITAAARIAGALAHKMTRLIGILARGGESWAVGWRAAGSRSLLDRREATFTVKSDDGGRYLADPFPFHHAGRNFVFVEEFPYATGRGCISVFEIDAAGKAGATRTVLEEPHHLSYPFVFELDGEIWMIPEAGEARGVYLYRAQRFPEKWQREGSLIGGIEAYDATLMRRDGCFWLFLCERAWRSSGWDILTLYHSDSITGAWTPHARNPVLIDASLSRPGGAVFTRNGVDVRPAQDCSQFYGGAVSLCRIDALGPEVFAQTLLGRIHAGKLGCHTYNRRGGVEVIDVFGRVRGLSSVAAFFTPQSAAELSAGDGIAHAAATIKPRSQATLNEGDLPGTHEAGAA